jgi:aspartate kinase
VADADQIEKARNIVAQKSKRRNVIVSAPGKDPRYGEKITDHLINIATDGDHFRDARKTTTPHQSREAVLEKFQAITRDLSIQDKSFLQELEEDLKKGQDIDDRHKRIAFTPRGGNVTTPSLSPAVLPLRE